MSDYDVWLQKLINLSDQLRVLINEFPQPAPAPSPTPAPTPAPTPTPTPVLKKPIYAISYMVSGITAAVLKAYNCIPAPYVYQNQIPDANSSGTWDGKTSNYTGKLSSIPTGYYGCTFLDWEKAPWNGGFLTGLKGGNGSATQATAQKEAIKALEAWQGDRANCKFGMYGAPYFENNFTHCLPMNSQTLAQETTLHDLWSTEKAVMPSVYMRVREGNSTTGWTVADPTMTRSDMKEAVKNIAILMLKCAANGGTNPVVCPLISRFYYHGGAPYDDKPAPLEWVHCQVSVLCNTAHNGKTADAVYIWDGSSKPDMTEPELKAIYQAVNGLPFDPNMARPA